MIATTARWLGPPLLTELNHRYPSVHLVVVEATSTSLEERLFSGRVDLAVVEVAHHDPGLRLDRLFDEELLLVVPPDHALAGRGEVDLADLGGVELILPPTDEAFRTELDQAAKARGVELRARAELDGVCLIASITFDGHGAAILPATAVPAFLADRYRTLVVKGLPCRQVGMAWRGHGMPSAAVTAVQELLRYLVNNEARPDRGIFLAPAKPGDRHPSEPINLPSERHPEIVTGFATTGSDWDRRSADGLAAD
jgi:LysR family hydrogen peroxide-inducible transcriptional activator